ncbi:MAG: TPM domain-containing protein [Clostridia bacterium]|nr:TPM domain-containing protein [Clostridia bacterium]
MPCFASVPQEPEKVVYDRADLLSDANESALNDAVREVWSMAENCSFYVATHELTYRYAPYYTGDDFLDDHDFSSSNNLVLLVITLDQGTYYYNMYTYGNATNRIRDQEVDFILDHDDVYPNIKSGKLLEGASAFMSLAVKAYDGRIAGASYVTIVIVSFVIALIIGVVACVGVKSAYSMKKKSVDYPLNKFAKLELTDQKDVFTGSFVTKRIIDTDSGGRGGSGGGGRGGGGGHRGGR